MDKKLSEYSDIELKAFAYDCLATIQANQNNLNAFNGELSRRVQSAGQSTPTPSPHSDPPIIPRLGSAQSV